MSAASPIRLAEFVVERLRRSGEVVSGARAAIAWHGTLSEMGMVLVSSTIAGPIAQILAADGAPMGAGGEALERAFPRFADDLTW